MKNNIEKIIKIEKSISEKYGEFNLFAIIEREDIKGKWDVLISKVIKNNNEKNLLINDIHKSLVNELPKEEIIKLSRIVFQEPNSPVVQNINFMMHIEHGSADISNSSINNLRIGHMILITSKRSK